MKDKVPAESRADGERGRGYPGRWMRGEVRKRFDHYVSFHLVKKIYFEFCNRLKWLWTSKLWHVSCLKSKTDKRGRKPLILFQHHYHYVGLHRHCNSQRLLLFFLSIVNAAVQVRPCLEYNAFPFLSLSLSRWHMYSRRWSITTVAGTMGLLVSCRARGCVLAAWMTSKATLHVDLPFANAKERRGSNASSTDTDTQSNPLNARGARMLFVGNTQHRGRWVVVPGVRDVKRNKNQTFNIFQLYFIPSVSVAQCCFYCCGFLSFSV